MNYFERQEYIKNLTKGTTPDVKVSEPLSFDPEETLTVNDIQKDYKKDSQIYLGRDERVGRLRIRRELEVDKKLVSSR